MSEDKGFLFNVVSNIGDGHQIQVAFNAPVGATSDQFDAIFDEFFKSAKRQAARLRLPTIEMEVGMQTAKVEGVTKAYEKIRDKPAVIGKHRSTQDEAHFSQAETQLDADKARLELLKKNLELTQIEAGVPVGV